MNREIKFKGISAEDGAICYGFLYIDKENKYWILTPKNTNNFLHADEVIPETVGQYTGLKDKNGNKIYEGDVVFKSSETKVVIATSEKVKDYSDETGIIEFTEGMFVTKWVHGNNSWFGKYPHFDLVKSYAEYCEIIGNIHTNPELNKPQP